jgi:prevent-host-death family protein
MRLTFNKARCKLLTIILVNPKGGQLMKTLSLSEAKMKLSKLIENVYSTDEEITITKNGRPAAVLISPEEFESLKEMVAIKSDHDLMKEIKKGLSALKRKTKLYTLEELFE